MTCASAALCDKTNKTCVSATCTVGSHHCAGAELQICNGSQTDWDDQEPCATAALCDAVAGACKPAVCEPGTDFQCLANGDLQECKADRTGYQKKDALHLTGVLRLDRRCLQPRALRRHRLSMQRALLQKCKADRTGWNTLDTCDTAALCDEATMQCNVAACGVGEHDCAGADLLVCNPGRTGFVKSLTCTSAGLCDKVQGQCDVCTPGQFSCNLAELQQCDPDGQADPVAQTCNSAGHCVANGSSGSCLLCDPNEFRCSGSELQKCAPISSASCCRWTAATRRCATKTARSVCQTVPLALRLEPSAGVEKVGCHAAARIAETSVASPGQAGTLGALSIVSAMRFPSCRPEVPEDFTGRKGGREVREVFGARHRYGHCVALRIESYKAIHI